LSETDWDAQLKGTNIYLLDSIIQFLTVSDDGLIEML